MPSETVNFTVYQPVCVGVKMGSCVVAPVVPSLSKSHSHCIGLWADRSVKLTVRGAVPTIGVAEKSATGGTHTVRERCVFVFCGGFAVSVQVMMRLYVPSVPVCGVPDISPVFRFSESPADNASPDGSMPQIYVPVPPVAVRVWLYGMPSPAYARDVVVIASGA